MDWFSWLLKTTLDPSLAYEYALAFSLNELEEEDTVHFNHEFLQSMGISIAKHRLEILKLSRKQKPVSKLLSSIKRTKMNLTKYVYMATLICRPDPSSALVVINPRSRSGYADKRKGDMSKRNEKMNTPLLVSGSARVASFSSHVVFDYQKDEQIDGEDHRDDEDDGYWSSGVVGEIRWDTLFRDLKPN